jgi:hypothetical protein
MAAIWHDEQVRVGDVIRQATHMLRHGQRRVTTMRGAA